MLIRTKDNLHIPSSEITSENTFTNRRSVLKALGLAGAAFVVPAAANERKLYVSEVAVGGPKWLQKKLGVVQSKYLAS